MFSWRISYEVDFQFPNPLVNCAAFLMRRITLQGNLKASVSGYTVSHFRRLTAMFRYGSTGRRGALKLSPFNEA